MPVLDDCVTSAYEPGNIGASTGAPPVIITPGTLYTPETYDPATVEYSLNFSRFYNSAYIGAF
jgi:hypothetical protein